MGTSDTSRSSRRRSPSRRLIIAATGHRPNKLGGYGDDTLERATVLACRFLQDRKPSSVITGMALGWDTAIALAAQRLRIPYIAAVPFQGQQSMWPMTAKQRYQTLLEAATEVVMVTRGGYSPQAMHLRNRWMVDRCDLLVALWNGTPGGTAACVAYAKQVEREWINLWPEWRNLT
jgi:uncharacterized phage-like protein YoqJ